MGTVEFRRGTRQLQVNAPIRHTGNVSVYDSGTGAHEVMFEAANTYDGITEVHGGALNVQHRDGLGSPANGTFLYGGTLQINAGSVEPIVVLGGKLGFLGFGVDIEPFDGQLTLRGGTLALGTQTILRPLVIESGQRPTVTGYGGIVKNISILSGGVTGVGDIEFSPNRQLNIDGPLSLDGNIFVTAGDTHINTQNSFGHRISVENGAITFNENNFVESLHVIRGQVNVAPGKSLHVTDLRLLAGEINGTLTGLGTLTKPGLGTVVFSDIGAGFDGDIVIPSGTIEVGGPNGLGIATGTTTVLGSENAALLIRDTSADVVENINLNNATGLASGDGLVARGQATLTGNIELGAIGSSIGILPSGGSLTLGGSLSGGSLTAIAEGDGALIRISGGNHSYTGPTYIRTGDGSPVLVEDGQLHSTESIVLENGRLLLENSASGSEVNRIGDEIPITIRRGAITLQGRDSVVSSETLGSVTAEIGNVEIQSFQDRFEQPSSLTIENFSRHPGVTVNFMGSSLGKSIETAKIHLQSPLPMSNGILPAWATDHRGWATIGPFGVTQFQGWELGFDSANVTSNVEVRGAQSLVGDTTANSLQMFTSDALDLGESTLQLSSGGLINNYAGGEIRNGAITAGENGPSELIIYAFEDFSISADIVDNATGAVSLLKAGDRRLILNGPTNYTGATVVNAGELIVDSLPVGRTLIMNAGSLEASNEVSLGSFEMLGGRVYGHPIHAADVRLAEGTVYTDFLGNSEIRKISPGIIRMNGSLANFEGDLQVNEG